MYDLFDVDPVAKRQRYLAPYFDNARTYVNRDLNRVVDYYRNNVTFVNNQHLLVRFLLTLNVSFKREWNDYRRAVRDTCFNIAGLMGVSTPLSFGRVMAPGFFYGKRMTEIVLGHDEPFDIKDAVQNWRDLRPVRVLRHPYSDMSMARPTGDYKPSMKSDIAVIAINLPMLAVQYRAWCEQERVDLNSDLHRATVSFVSMYPITNALFSHMDIALFNRLSTLYDGEKPDSYVRSNPIMISDQSGLVDMSLRRAVGELGRVTMNFDHLVDNIPLFTEPNLRSLLVMPNTIPNRQIEWGMIVAVLPYIRFLVRFNAFTRNEMNSWHLNRLRYWLQVIRNDRTLENILPNNVYRDIDDALYRDIGLYVERGA